VPRRRYTPENGIGTGSDEVGARPERAAERLAKRLGRKGGYPNEQAASPASETQSPWFLNVVTVAPMRTQVIHPPFWHFLALGEFPPAAVAVATPTVKASVAHVRRDGDLPAGAAGDKPRRSSPVVGQRRALGSLLLSPSRLPLAGRGGRHRNGQRLGAGRFLVRCRLGGLTTCERRGASGPSPSARSRPMD